MIVIGISAWVLLARDIPDETAGLDVTKVDACSLWPDIAIFLPMSGHAVGAVCSANPFDDSDLGY